MLFKQFEDKGLSQFSYLIACEKEGVAAIVDPERNVDIYIHFAKENKLTIRYILETHIHADFASGSPELAELTGAEVLLSSYDTGEKYEYSFPHTELKDRQKINVGSTAQLQTLHTPGHTPEHISFLVYDLEKSKDEPVKLLSGDFLFMGSLGRPDLLGEDEKLALAKKLYASVNTKLTNLRDELKVYPGHGAGSLCGANLTKGSHSTLGAERQINPYLKEKFSEDEFLKKIFANTPPFPQYYLRMKEWNAKGQPFVSSIPAPEAMSADEFEEESANGVILDTRQPLTFGGAHIPDSVNITLDSSFSFWAAWVIPYDMPVFLVLEDEHKLETARRALARVGLDDVQGYLKPGFQTWVASGSDFRDIPQASVLFLDDMLDAGEKLTVLDVRSDSEWKDGHIKSARHIYLGELKDKLDKLPKNDETIFCICGGGYRSSVAASLLQAAGYEMVYNVYGGMGAWKAAGLHVTESV